MNPRIYRIIDANLNRSREGLRVCEDIARFILDNSKLTSRFKNYRHRLTILSEKLPSASRRLIKSRNSQQDIGKYLPTPKRRSKEIREIFIVNIRRSEEALRVLEEFSKIINKKISEDFRKLRFRLYILEQKTLLELN
jgi:thiamine-phosphate pyrophosphorylase